MFFRARRVVGTHTFDGLDTSLPRAIRNSINDFVRMAEVYKMLAHDRKKEAVHPFAGFFQHSRVKITSGEDRANYSKKY